MAYPDWAYSDIAMTSRPTADKQERRTEEPPAVATGSRRPYEAPRVAKGRSIQSATSITMGTTGASPAGFSKRGPGF